MNEYNQRKIGTCSLCGGDVVRPIVRITTLEFPSKPSPPDGKCLKCGAIEPPPEPVKYPIIKMVDNINE